MVPRKAKDLYAVVAAKMGISEDLVKDAVGIYWSDVRKALTNMEYHAIFVENLGTFKSKEQRLLEALEKYERLYKYNDGENFRKMKMKTELHSRIEKIKRLLSLIEGDKVKKQQIKDKRYGTSTDTNMEEQTSNPSGTGQQDIQDRTGGEDLCEEDEDM